MNLFRRCFAVSLLAVSCAAEAVAEFKLPPINGELSGNFTPVKAPGAPTVRWTIKMHDAESGVGRVADVTVEGSAANLRAELRLDGSGGGSWRVIEGKLDLAPWVAALAANFGAEFEGISAGGTMTATGEGTLRDGEPTGRATITVCDGRIDDPAHKFSLEGVAFELVFEEIAERRTAPAQVFTWTGGRYDLIALGAGRVVLTLAGDEVQVEEAKLAVLGGNLALGAFVFSHARPEISVTATIVGAEVSLLLPLLPPVVSAARGRVDGTINLRRDATGIQIGAGRLALREGEMAELRLAPTPGLLSASLPAAALKYYPGLGGIEKGTVPLQASKLEVTFTPEGDAEGRTAMVHIAGGPVDPQLKAPIDLIVNVRGPLETLVKFGSRVRFGGKP